MNLKAPKVDRRKSKGLKLLTFGASYFSPARRGAFTLAEMLVVIAIIGIMAAIALPRLSTFGKSNAMTTANRQMLDDVAYARQKAINDHTKVYMVFLPPEFWKTALAGFNNLTGISRTNADELISGQCTSYALFSARSIGDQPGKKYPRYLTEWKSLPDGVLFETNKFLQTEIIASVGNTNVFTVEQFATNLFHFPSPETTNDLVPFKLSLPYIAFDSQGRLTSGKDEFIPLVHGSVFIPRDNVTKQPLLGPPDIIETGYREPTRTNYNLIRIDWLTGRAKVERIELQ
jgi:prepilin-type N-terminal cleavage/methylation domain-containing protein